MFGKLLNSVISVAILFWVLACSFGGESEDEVEAEFKQTITPMVVTNELVVYALEVAENRFELWTVTPDGGTKIGISDIFSANSQLNPVALSADGTLIGYQADKDNDGFDELYTNSLLGDSEVMLTDNLGDSTVTSEGIQAHINWQWMTDNTNRIVFRSDTDNDDIVEIISQSADGIGLQALSDELSVTCVANECWKLPQQGSVVTFLVEELDDQDQLSQRLYSVASAGGDPVMLNPELSADSQIIDWQWSSNNSALAFISEDMGEAKQLYTISSDGSDRVLINPDSVSVGVDNFSWSPDGNSLAFSDDPDGIVSLYSNVIDGSEPVHLIDTVEVSAPQIIDWQWAPDNNRIGFRADQSTEGRHELFTVETDGQWHRTMNGQMLTDTRINDNWLWSPDGQFVSFFAEQQTQRARDELYISRADGSSRVLVNPTLTDDAEIVADNIYWLTDSSRLIYQIARQPPAIDFIYSVLADGTGSARLSPSLQSNEAMSDWFLVSPDDNHVLFQVINLTTSRIGLHRSTVDGVSKNILTSAGIIRQVSWLPDSSRIIYVFKTAQDESENLFSIELDGSNKIELE